MWTRSSAPPSRTNSGARCSRSLRTLAGAESRWTPSRLSPMQGPRASGAASPSQARKLSTRSASRTGPAALAPSVEAPIGRSSTPFPLTPSCGRRWKRLVLIAGFVSWSCRWASYTRTGTACWRLPFSQCALLTSTASRGYATPPAWSGQAAHPYLRSWPSSPAISAGWSRAFTCHHPPLARAPWPIEDGHCAAASLITRTDLHCVRPSWPSSTAAGL